MSSLVFVKNAIDRGEESRIIELDGENIISGNFLESLVELNAAKENSEIEITTRWSILAAEQPQVTKVIKFSNDYIPVLENMISKIRPLEIGTIDDFIGKISLTKADPDIHARKEGEIILNFILGEEDKVSKARVILSNQDYIEACEAHKMGKSVKISGKLVTVGRSKVIETATFQIIH